MTPFAKSPAVFAMLCLACSASPTINIGNETDGAVAGSGGTGGFGGAAGVSGIGGFGGTDDALSAHVEEPPSTMAIEVVTIGCAGDCANVIAVASGGHPAYSFVWNDGVTTAAREICASDTSTFRVTVTDTPIDDTEFHYDAQTVTAEITAQVIACASDGGTDAALPTQEVNVPGSADLWLAGQPDGTTLPAFDNTGMDVAPTHSPIGVSVMAGSTLTFSVSGATSHTAGLCVAPSGDGGCTAGFATVCGPANGLSSLAVQLNALIGVFLDDAVPSGTPPAALDASGTNDFATLAPELRQVFFIGDGLTATGSGAAQQFVVPSGATRLFLGSSDSAGGNFNNTGNFIVLVSR